MNFSLRGKGGELVAKLDIQGFGIYYPDKVSMNYKKIFKKFTFTLKVEDERSRLVLCISIVFVRC